MSRGISGDMSHAPDVSIIIVSFNTKEILRNCLQSVIERTGTISFEIIVVDNDSADGSAQMVADCFPEVVLLRSGSNLGFGKANNYALRKANGNYVLYLNPDTLLLNDAVAILHAFLTSNGEECLVGPRLFTNVKRKHHPSIRKYTRPMDLFFAFLPGARFVMAAKQRFWVDLNKTQRVDWLVGAALMAPRDTLLRYDGFDETFFVYSEEEDLCHRMQIDGIPTYYLPDAEIVHLGGQSSKQMPTKANEFFWKSKMQYFKKYHTNQEIGRFVTAFVFLLKLKALFARPDARKYLLHTSTLVKNYYVDLS